MIVVMDADGNLTTTHPLPAGAELSDFASSVSPDGKWLAYYLGSAEIQSAGGYELSLNLLNLSDGQTQSLTSLLSADYPDNFQAAAEELTRQGITIMDGTDTPIFLRDAFIFGIHSLAWLPDGEVLAFAGQMEGFSSDLYTYHVGTGTIQRLSDEIGQIQSITWSPDSKWILYGTANYVGAGMETIYHAAALDGSRRSKLFTGVSVFWEWLTPDRYLQWNVTAKSLQSVDIETGSIQSLWQGDLLSLSFDPVYDNLAVIGRESTSQDSPMTLYLVDVINGDHHKVKESVSVVKFWGFGKRRFIANLEDKNFFVLTDGSFVESVFNEENTTISISPDLRMIAVLGGRLDVYSWGSELINEINLFRPVDSEGTVIWRSDIPGAFLTLDNDLYAANFLDTEARLIDEDILGIWDFHYILTTPMDFGAEAVWDAPRDTEFADCSFSAYRTLPCVVSLMQVSGATQGAIDFTRLVHGQGYMSSFIESGRVDVASVIFLPRPNDILQNVMINGSPRVVHAAEDLGQIDITRDPIYPVLLGKYPGLTIWESLNNYEGMEQLPDGGQRFIHSYDLVDGCHICRTGARALVGFDFDRAGQFTGTTFLYLQE